MASIRKRLGSIDNESVVFYAVFDDVTGATTEFGATTTTKRRATVTVTENGGLRRSRTRTIELNRTDEKVDITGLALLWSEDGRNGPMTPDFNYTFGAEAI